MVGNRICVEALVVGTKESTNETDVLGTAVGKRDGEWVFVGEFVGISQESARIAE